MLLATTLQIKSNTLINSTQQSQLWTEVVEVVYSEMHIVVSVLTYVGMEGFTHRLTFSSSFILWSICVRKATADNWRHNLAG